MLTINYTGLQERYGISKKKKNKPLVKSGYKLTKGNFSASDWKDYKDWLKEQKDREKAEAKAKSKKKKKSKAKAEKNLRGCSERKKEYSKELENPMWRAKREIILKRDDYTCTLCGSKENLCVHHLKYIKGNKAWQYPNKCLITLCKDCHKKVHHDKTHKLYPEFLPCNLP